MKRATQQSIVSDERGMISFAVFVLLVTALALGVSMLFMAMAVISSGDGLTTARSQYVEKNGLAGLVKESILAVRETAPINSTNAIDVEINTRLSAITFPDGVSMTLSSFTAVPAHNFFPNATAPVASLLPMFAPVGQPKMAGSGNTCIAILSQGPAADMGTLTYKFARTVSGSPAESLTYTVNAELYSVPITNYGIVAYGLIASGGTPTSTPVIPSLLFSNGASGLVVTSNNPANDPTAYSDMFIPGNPEVLPTQYKNAASFSWNAYEYIWGNAYQNALITASGTLNTYDFSSGNNPAIPGVTPSGYSLSIDVSSVSSQVISVVDSLGVGSITINGAATNGAPFILYVKSTNATATTINFSGNNARPFILIARNCALSFSGSPVFAGGILLDRNSTASGACTVQGHVSFYALASPFPAWNLQLLPNSVVKAALAPLAPRVLLVSTRANR